MRRSQRCHQNATDAEGRRPSPFPIASRPPDDPFCLILLSQITGSQPHMPSGSHIFTAWDLLETLRSTTHFLLFALRTCVPFSGCATLLLRSSWQLLTDATEMFTQYNTGIHKCHQFIAASVHYTANTNAALHLTTILLLLDTKELTERTSVQVAIHLRNGEMDQASLQAILVAQDLRSVNLHRALLQSGMGPLQSLLESSVVKNMEEVETRLIGLGVSKGNNATLATEFLQVDSAYVDALNTHVTKSIQHLQNDCQREINSVAWNTVALSCIASVAVIFGAGIGIWAARGIAMPFNELHDVKSQLSTERLSLQAQRQMVQAFVPYETLALLGCSDITSLEMGTSCLKQLTVMFVSITDFQEISGRLSLEESISYLNTWLEGVIPQVSKTCVFFCTQILSRVSCVVPPSQFAAQGPSHRMGLFVLSVFFCTATLLESHFVGWCWGSPSPALAEVLSA